MDITFNVSRPEGAPGSGPVRVGWFLHSQTAALLYAPPERVVFRPPNRDHAKSAARCPGVLQMESRHFMVRCPVDIHVGFTRDKDGRPALINRAGTASTIRANKLGQMLVMVPEAEWRYPDRPTIQLLLPYCFVADEPCYITQLDSFAHYRPTPLPGTIFGGRFPIHAWVRPIMWAMEWHDTSRDLVLRRGDPLFYLTFETNGPDRPLQLVETERTPELLAWMEKMNGVVNYVSQTFSLFKAAEAARPPSLIRPVDNPRSPD